MIKLLVAIFLFMSGCTVVGPGERGIRFYFGKANNTVEEPGAYLWLPFFMGMKEIDVQVQKSEVETSAASKDMQEIKTQLAVNWKLAPEKVVTTYKNVGDEDAILERIIRPAVSEVLKASTSKLTAEEILKKRMELKTAIDAGLKERLDAYGIDLFDVSIVHLSFTEGFEQAIEATQVAEQRAKQASYEADKATQDARAAVEQAKGQKASQELVRASLTKELLQKMAIEKWNGAFPQVMGSGALPFINLKMSDK
jgi:regulator of protease activity HflC (stomatin/prohibitin superfamily)